MTIDEKERLDRMEQHLKMIQLELQHISAALVGNELNGNKGLVHDFKDLEINFYHLKDRITELEKENIKKGVIIDILKAVSFVLFGGLVSLVINIFFNK